MVTLNRRSLLLPALAFTALGLGKQARADLAAHQDARQPADRSSIMDQLLHATLHIESRGPEGLRLGTGLIFTFLATVPCLVATRELLADASSCRLTFAGVTPAGGPDLQNHVSIEVNDLKDGVIVHPSADVDLSILPLAPLLHKMQDAGKFPFFRAAAPALIPMPEQLEVLSAFQDVFILGYPGKLWDDVNNLPLVMRSVTASPASLNFKGKQEFLINTRAFSGGLGSPVFAYHQSGQSSQPEDHGSDWIYLVGILTGEALRTAAGGIGVGTIPAVSGEDVSASSGGSSLVDLAVCQKASCILEFEPELQKRGVPTPDNYLIRATLPASRIR
jgi:hypothetical protein